MNLRVVCASFACLNAGQAEYAIFCTNSGTCRKTAQRQEPAELKKLPVQNTEFDQSGFTNFQQ
jgi:hypothetical protein